MVVSEDHDFVLGMLTRAKFFGSRNMFCSEARILRSVAVVPCGLSGRNTCCKPLCQIAS